MPRNQTVGNLALVNYEDIFNVGIDKADGERIILIPLSDLHAPEFHPFNVTDDDAIYISSFPRTSTRKNSSRASAIGSSNMHSANQNGSGKQHYFSARQRPRKTD